MSTINEALKKAQKEKDTRYQKFSGSLSARGRERRLFRHRPLLWTSLTLIIIFFAFTAYSWLDFGVLQTPVTSESQINTPTLTLSRPRNEEGGTFGKGGENSANSIPLPAASKAEAAGGGEKRKLLRNKPKRPATAIKKKTVIDAKESYERARHFHKSGNLQEAGSLYRETLRVDPGYVDALNNLGVIYIHEQDYPAARISLEKATRLRPGYVEPYYNLACLHAIKGEIEESMAHLKKAVSLDQSVRDWARMDTDLENLRGVPEFEEIIRSGGME